jgi:hypothetical protein
MTTTSFQRPCAITLGLALLACLPQAQAQSGYTMTVLSKPSTSDAVHYIPRQIDDQGVVRGISYYKAGVTLSALSLKFVTTWSPQAVSWGAGTAASVAPTLGAKKFRPLWSNQQGTTIGQIPPKPLTLEQLYPLYDSVQFLSYYGSGVIRQGNVDTPFPAGSFFTPVALNNAGLIIGRDSATLTNGPSYPAQLLNGTFTALDQGDFTDVYPRLINDAGVIVGTGYKEVFVTDANGVQQTQITRPALMWVNGRLSELKVPQAMGPDVSPYFINNAGQVVIGASQFRWAIWFNGVTTPLPLEPVSLEGARPIIKALNDAGTIAGCENLQAQTFPFLVKNNVKIDLAKELAAKGIKPPTGYSWGCPIALNNAGSMVMYYWKPLSDPLLVNTSVVWVRINAKP